MNAKQPWTCEASGLATAEGESLDYHVRDGDADLRAAFLVRHDAENYARERNRAAGVPEEVGDAAGEVEANLRDRLDDLRLLTRAAGRAEDLSYGELAALEALGVGDTPKHGEEATDIGSEAEERLDEYPLCVEVTTTFEIVIGTGGPDDRLLVECDVVRAADSGSGYLNVHEPRPAEYEIRRVLYRYSWTGSAERELRGEDLAAAKEFARRVVPELTE